MKMLKKQYRTKHGIILLLLVVTVPLLWDMMAYVFLSNQWQLLQTKVSICFTRAELEPPTIKLLSNSSTTKPVTNSTTTKIQFRLRTTRPPAELQTEPKLCSFKYLSPENTVEGRKLLDSITWPETLPVPKPFSLNLTTNAAKSTFTIVTHGRGWRVGDELTVRIQVNDYNGNPKKGGGDFIISRLHNQQLGAGVVGQVQDHHNGTFTAVFPLLWNGTAQVEVMLVQTSESITVLKRLTEEQPDRIYFTSEFRSGSVQESSICNVCLDPAKAPLCNLTDLNTGERWFCYKPKKLSCDTRVSHFKGGFNQRISKKEETLFRKGVNMKVPIKAIGIASVMVLPRANYTSSKITTSTSWSEEVSHSDRLGPSGYYYEGQWRPLGGTTVQQFNQASAISQCLKGKVLHMYGDSTIRQWFEYLRKTVPDLKTFDLHSSSQSGPFLALDFSKNILVTYRSHGPPIRFRNVPVSQLRYVANELDGVTGGPDTVVLIGVWSHFSTFPMEVYYQRLVTIRKAIQRLKNRAPDTKVVVRTANMKDLTLYETLTNSDWYSLQRDRVLRAVFKHTDVLLLDAWEMGQAHNLPHNLHPQPEIIKLMIDVVLSYTCPV